MNPYSMDIILLDRSPLCEATVKVGVDSSSPAVFCNLLGPAPHPQYLLKLVEKKMRRARVIGAPPSDKFLDPLLFPTFNLNFFPKYWFYSKYYKPKCLDLITPKTAHVGLAPVYLINTCMFLITQDMFQGLGSLSMLWLYYNRMTTLNSSAFVELPRPITIALGQGGTYRDNPWSCDDRSLHS